MDRSKKICISIFLMNYREPKQEFKGLRELPCSGLKSREASLVCFESTSNSFQLLPDLDEVFRVTGPRDTVIFKIGLHEIEFRVSGENYTRGFLTG